MNPLKRFFSSNFFKGFLFSVALFTSPKALGSETKLLQANLKASFQKDKDKISKPLCLNILSRLGARYWEARSFKEQEKITVRYARLSVSQNAAHQAAGKVYLNLRNVAQEIRNKNLRKAYMYLNDGECFEGTHIRMLPFDMRSHRVLELSHFDFSKDFVEYFVRLPELNSDIYFSLEFDPYLLKGTVVTSEIKIALGPVEYSIWEKRFDGNNLIEAVRLNHVLGLFEEKAHALQHLNQVLGFKPYIRLNSEEIREAEKMEEELNREKESRGEYSVTYAQEADVYAFMFDLFESENLPKAYGIYSGYLTRAIVDRNRGRPWSEKEWSEALEEYGYNSRALP